VSRKSEFGRLVKEMNFLSAHQSSSPITPATQSVSRMCRNDEPCKSVRLDYGRSKDVFVHISALERAGMSSLNEGQQVSFEVVADRRTGKSSAENLRAV
jgi:cold shock CspA family protein